MGTISEPFLYASGQKQGWNGGVVHVFWQTIARFAWRTRHIPNRKERAIAGCEKRGAYRFCIHEMYLANLIPCTKIDFLAS